MPESDLLTGLRARKKIKRRQIAEAQADFLTTTDSSLKPVLEGKIDVLTEELKQLHHEILSVEQGFSEPKDLERRLDESWETAKYQINCNETFRIFENKIRGCFQDRSAAALFVAHQCEGMKIDHFLKRSKNWLSIDPEFRKYDILPERKIIIDFTDFLNEDTFIARLRSNLGINEPDISLTKILQIITEPLHKKSILILTIEIQCNVHENFLDWLQNHFWPQMIQQINERSILNPWIGIIAFVYALDPIFPQLTPNELSLIKDYNDPQNIHPIWFSNWSIADLTKWFEKHTELTELCQRYNLVDQQYFDSWCQHLHRKTGGRPESIFPYVEEIYRDKKQHIMRKVNYEWHAAF